MKVVLLFVCLFALAAAVSFRNERVVSAQHMVRPVENKLLNKAGVSHHGVKVQTDKGNNYLIHNTPKSGVVVTNAPMSSKWTVKENIPVNGQKTVGETLKAGSGVTNIPAVNYVTAGTCVNTAKNAKEYLGKKK